MSKLCVITGATSGIGHTVALGLASKGWNLAVVGRSKEKGEALKAEVQAVNAKVGFSYYQADLSVISHCKNVAAEILADHPVIDVLINNAGGVFAGFEETEDSLEKTIANNHLSYYILTLSLLEALKKADDPRIINVSSGSHYKGKIDFRSFTDPGGYSTMASYGQSKLANVLFTYSLAEKLEKTGIAINTLHPGVVKTKIGNKSDSKLHGWIWTLFSNVFGISTEESAKTYLYLATDPDARNHHGVYFHSGKPKASSKLSYDKKLQEKLWKWSAEVTGMDL